MPTKTILRKAYEILDEDEDDLTVNDLAYEIHKKGLDIPRDDMMQILWDLISDGHLKVDLQFHVSRKVPKAKKILAH
ncbi:MAG: hypothetical protein WC708_09020 [Lentisphaeria bacterium]